MNRREARNVPLQTFTDAFASNPKPSFRPESVDENGESNGRHWAVYTGKGRRSTLIGLITTKDLLECVAAAYGCVQHAGGSIVTDEDGGEQLAMTVGAGDKARRDRLNARKARRLAELSEIEAELSETSDADEPSEEEVTP
jgi:hypothetical protein